MEVASMNEAIESLWEEVRELSLGNSVERLDNPPTPINFLRDFVSQNRPCVISGGAAHWPALSLWSDPAYLSSALADSLVSLHLTPDGRADTVSTHPSGGLCFASAHVETVPFPHALNSVRRHERKPVAYLQQQNDCFRSEYGPLKADCDADVPWATAALGRLPEDVNLWIGNRSSETSFHKDHYENLYAVVSGEKHFLLLPPTDVHRMYIRRYPAARYSWSQDKEELVLELEEPLRYVPWSSVEPYLSPANEEREKSKFPLYFNGPKPFHCTLKAGDILYLPSMWFHHVRQSPGDGGCTIAVNYWYDMEFDIKYAYFNFLYSLELKSPHDPVLEDVEYGDSGSSTFTSK